MAQPIGRAAFWQIRHAQKPSDPPHTIPHGLRLARNEYPDTIRLGIMDLALRTARAFDAHLSLFQVRINIWLGPPTIMTSSRGN
jgi:hypothetical protein